MEKDPKFLEQKAYTHLSQDEFHQSFVLYEQAANIYKNMQRHKQAALCFASAASCWSKKSGERTFYKAAFGYQQAAEQAEKSRDLEYASMLYRYAAINYERDREFFNFSECFYRSKECYRHYLTYRLFKPNKIHPIIRSKEEKGVKGALKRIFFWLGLNLSWLVWGHGERPRRTFYTGILIIFLSALFYMGGYLINEGAIIRPHFLQAFYFSVITFTTVGYGDFTPLGWVKFIVMLEALCGLFVVPIFIIGLSRKYLRI